MKRIALTALLVCGSISFGTLAATEETSSVRIVTEEVHMKQPPRIIAFRAQVFGLTPPLRFHWNLGNGKQWDKQFVPEQAYGPGRYDVILTISDAAGLTKSASMAIDSEAPGGCGH